MFSAIMSSLFFSFLLHSFFSIWDLIPYKIVLQVLVALFFFPVVFFFFPNFYFSLHNFCEPVFKFTGFVFSSALSIS